ncbi:helix-turn-helix domain-containing protein [Streptomyces sp. NPDC058280]|uniref:helix-turn-helix domain-containing protein n=1 Tax=Streptomyces sp. NPDC058280 TaxID=3346419 RepID=UPI0036E508FB
MTTAPNDPGDRGADPGEDLAALLTRVLEETGREQKQLANEAGISYTRLNSWLTRARGTSRIAPEDLRAMANVLRGWGASVTPAQLFGAVGRPVPGPADREREERLLSIYRQLSISSQRALIQHAELLLRSARAS